MRLVEKYKIGRERPKYIVTFIRGCIKAGFSVVDIGCGGCEISKYLSETGFKVTAVDVKNKSRFKTITPIIYGGRRLPFKKNSFDASILIAVLHHVNKPEELIMEAARVSKKIIILEDIYTNALQKHATYFFDSLVNCQFVEHPHNNKSDKEWKQVFKKLRLKLVKTEYGRIWGVFTVALYYLEVLD